MINVWELIIFISCFFYVNFENFSGVLLLKLNIIYRGRLLKGILLGKEFYNFVCKSMMKLWLWYWLLDYCFYVYFCVLFYN